MSTIASVTAREIIDSRGKPTVECDVELADGTKASASVPSGASTGHHEAYELRDNESDWYNGLGVGQAVRNVECTLGPAIAGLEANGQEEIDELLITTDGTSDKSALGANAILAVSLAVSRAAAAARGIPLYRHIAELSGVDQPTVPMPMFNIISGGLHAGGQLDIQDVLVIPTGAQSFRDALHAAAKVHREIGHRVVEHGLQPLVADEGGWAPPLDTNDEALEWVASASADMNEAPRLALDIAASCFYRHDTDRYVLGAEQIELDRDGMIERIRRWVSEYGVISVEDGLAEDDWQGWQQLTAELGDRTQVLGDDLFATNLERLERGIAQSAANSVLVKPNQIGTLTEALRVLGAAKAAGFNTIVSARSGETEDSYVADLAVGSAAGQLKVGAITRSERLAKWNQILRIEEALGTQHFVGDEPFRTLGACFSNQPSPNQRSPNQRSPNQQGGSDASNPDC